jgi:hypothetical protein
MSNIEKDSPINKFITNEFPQQSSLISRLQQFIPQLSAANQRLKQDGTKTDSGITIESVAKDESDLDSDSEVNIFLVFITFI